MKRFLAARTRDAAAVVRSAAVLRRSGLATRADLLGGARMARDLRTWGTLPAVVRHAARRDPGRIGLVDELGELTYGELDRRSSALARAWTDAGLGPQSIVAMLCRDHRGLLDAVFAAGKIGATVLLLNTGFAARQVADVVHREGVTAVVYDEEFGPRLADLPEGVATYLAWTDERTAERSLESLIAAAPDQELSPPARQSRIVLLTSGTTGTPKGAPRESMSPLAGAQLLDRIPLRAGEATVLATPTFHGTGFGTLLGSILLSCTTVIRRRFDAEACLAAVERYRCTAVVLVPTMLHRMLDLSPETLGRYDTSSLRILLSAGSALPPALGNRAIDTFGDVLYNLYGSTECAVVTVATPQDWRRAPGTVGRPPVGCRVELCTPDGARIAIAGAPGAIHVGNGMAFAGYTDGSGKDTVDGLLATGDVGHFDGNGLLFVDGRADDMIVSGGENVYPQEVEQLLGEHDHVREAAVVGVPDDEFGQRLKAYVALEPGRSLSAAEVRAYVKANLARFKVPREVEFLPALPRNPTGKLVKRDLTAHQPEPRW